MSYRRLETAGPRHSNPTQVPRSLVQGHQAKAVVMVAYSQGGTGKGLAMVIGHEQGHSGAGHLAHWRTWRNNAG